MRRKQDVPIEEKPLLMQKQAKGKPAISLAHTHLKHEETDAMKRVISTVGLRRTVREGNYRDEDGRPTTVWKPIGMAESDAQVLGEGRPASIVPVVFQGSSSSWSTGGRGMWCRRSDRTTGAPSAPCQPIAQRRTMWQSVSLYLDRVDD